MSSGLALACCLFAAPAMGQEPDVARYQRLERLLVQDCGSCHGLRMKGGLGPALTPDILREKSRDMLIATVLLGRPGTPMPPWEPLLAREDVAWMIDRLIEGVKP